jgi:hypothetical protein
MQAAPSAECILGSQEITQITVKIELINYLQKKSKIRKKKFDQLRSPAYTPSSRDAALETKVESKYRGAL